MIKKEHKNIFLPTLAIHRFLYNAAAGDKKAAKQSWAEYINLLKENGKRKNNRSL
jgi:hypothetical protein